VSALRVYDPVTRRPVLIDLGPSHYQPPHGYSVRAHVIEPRPVSTSREAMNAYQRAYVARKKEAGR
jgi:hypothetical protein